MVIMVGSLVVTKMATMATMVRKVCIPHEEEAIASKACGINICIVSLFV